MTEPHDSHRRKELILINDLSPELEEKLMRRAREKKTGPAEEAAKILERHARESGDTE
jgi:hypothetical protein